MPFDRPSAAPLVFSGTSALKLRVLVGRSMLEVSSTISVAVVAVGGVGCAGPGAVVVGSVFSPS